MEMLMPRQKRPNPDELMKDIVYTHLPIGALEDAPLSVWCLSSHDESISLSG